MFVKFIPKSTYNELDSKERTKPKNYILFFFSFIFISWRLIVLQYCSGLCHTWT